MKKRLKLLLITGESELYNSSHKGAVFENLIIAEKLKQKENTGNTEGHYF